IMFNLRMLITGSANGIGSQIALNFASLGATLVLWDMDDEGNKETSRLAKKNGKRSGDVTILINNAGILLGKKFCDILDADFEKTLRVNFLSQVWTCKAFLPAMMTCNRGHLVSTTSAAGLLGVYSMSDYAGSNYAIIGMMETLDSEMYHAGKQGIKTTIICPYFINTELAKLLQRKLTLSQPKLGQDARQYLRQPYLSVEWALLRFSAPSNFGTVITVMAVRIPVTCHY
uniref:Short chain dehydrogenase/reductase family 16C member 5 n=1 Tax=Aquila chrysaetos chrysaetos TaxID=223781 RepID=A0A663E1X6_AQUCH